MCGIVGYVGARNATPVVYDGLKRLSNRGYDSAGIASDPGRSHRSAARAGKLDALRDLLYAQPLTGPIGMGHTAGPRTASESDERPPASRLHGRPRGDPQRHRRELPRNCAPSCKRRGHTFRSETDTKRSCTWWSSTCMTDSALKKRAPDPQSSAGSQAVVLMNRCQPDRLIAARIGNAAA